MITVVYYFVFCFYKGKKNNSKRILNRIKGSSTESHPHLPSQTKFMGFFLFSFLAKRYSLSYPVIYLAIASCDLLKIKDSNCAVPFSALHCLHVSFKTKVLKEKSLRWNGNINYRKKKQ